MVHQMRDLTVKPRWAMVRTEKRTTKAIPAAKEGLYA